MQNSKVAERIRLQKFLSLIEELELSDAELEALFQVHQSTVWRLKNGRIHKLDRYLAILGECLNDQSKPREQRLLDDLIALSHHSPEVKKILESLHSLMHERA